MDSPESPDHPRGLRVLVIEDNPDTAEMTEMVLRLHGHEAQLAPDGPTALRLARERLPDVVLLDIGLPGMNGWEVAGHLKAMRGPEDNRPFLVAVTGYGGDGDRRRSMEAGFDAHLLKPADPEELHRLLLRFQESIRKG